MSKLKKNEAIRIMKMRRRPDPGKEFWDAFGGRLEARMRNDSLVDKAAADSPAPGPPSRGVRFVPRWVYAGAAGAILLFAGIRIGRQIGPEPRPIVAGAKGAVGRNPVLAGQVSDYFSRSKVILLSIVNFDPAADDVFALNLAAEKQISRELVDRGRLLESLLTGPEDKRYRSLIADLKTILAQIANLDPEQSDQAVEIVRNGLKLREILFKISIAMMSLPAADKPAAAAL